MSGTKKYFKTKNGKNLSKMRIYGALKSPLITVLISLSVFLAFKYFNANQRDKVQADSLTYENKLKYWCVTFWDWNPFGNLRTMNRVFDRLDYVRVNGTEGDEWDVLWSVEYPFTTRNNFFKSARMPLKAHQKINHFPGINYITDKAFMTTRNRDIKTILPGFSFPQMIDEFKDYVKEHPKARFVEKGLENRGIRLVSKEEIKFDKSNKFYQLFMEKPFLVEGHFMDFSSYILISSIDPVRIYRFDSELHARFCPKPYYPFDPKDLDKYVISDSRILFLEHEGVKHYFEKYGYSFKSSLEDYFRKKGHNVTELWRKIDETIVKLVVNNEKHFLAQTNKLHNSTSHFFELVRADFLLNEDLEPHLTEVNMSPGMTPNADIAQVTSPYLEQMVYDTLNMVGARTKSELMSRYDFLTNEMISNSKNIAVKPGICIDNDCYQNCGKIECELCMPCINKADISAMHRAYRENTRLGGFKRIFPTQDYFNDDFINSVSESNQKSLKWFKAKCEDSQKDSVEWC